MAAGNTVFKLANGFPVPTDLGGEPILNSAQILFGITE